MQTSPIEWRYQGRPDFFLGTGATTTEKILAHAAAGVVTAMIVGFLWVQEYEAAQGWRLLALVVLAYDVAGGVTANMLNSCKRFYHAPLHENERGFYALVKNPYAFVGLHIHPIATAWIFAGSIADGITWYGLLLAATILTHATPLYLRRAVASTFVVCAVLLNLYLLPMPLGLEWFVPCLFIKIIMGHAVREEPYRPGAA